MEEIDEILSAVTAKDAHVLCREVMSITDTMDVLRAKWNVEILTAILCGQTRFKDALTPILEEIAQADGLVLGFSESAKRQYRDENWEQDLQKAYDAGKRMAEKMA